MKEIWKDISEYEGYQVSNLGRIRTYNKITYTKFHGERHWENKILKERLDKKNKSLSVQLYKNGRGKNYLIYRLVAETFIPNPYNLPEVNHIDGNRLNNCVSNLEWVNRKQNIKHAWDNDLVKTNKKVKIINKKNNVIKEYISLNKASIAINKNKGYISSKILKNIYENKEYRWELIN